MAPYSGTIFLFTDSALNRKVFPSSGRGRGSGKGTARESPGSRKSRLKPTSCDINCLPSAGRKNRASQRSDASRWTFELTDLHELCGTETILLGKACGDAQEQGSEGRGEFSDQEETISGATCSGGDGRPTASRVFGVAQTQSVEF